MKKVIITLFAVLALASTQAFGQAFAGLGYFNATYSGHSSAQANGFYAGVGYDIALSGQLAVTPGIYYGLALGAEDALGGKTNEHLVAVPVHFSYGFELASDTKVFPYLGPMFEYGLSKEYTNGKISVKGYGDDARRFNILLGGGVGLDVANIRITVGYDRALLSYSTEEDYNIGKGIVRLGVGYKF